MQSYLSQRMLRYVNDRAPPNGYIACCSCLIHIKRMPYALRSDYGTLAFVQSSSYSTLSLLFETQECLCGFTNVNYYVVVVVKKIFTHYLAFVCFFALLIFALILSVVLVFWFIKRCFTHYNGKKADLIVLMWILETYEMHGRGYENRLHILQKFFR